MIRILREYWLWLLLVIVILGLEACKPWLQQWLQFDRNGLDHGQFWRLISANFTHLSFYHAAGNCGGLLLVAYLLGNSVRHLRVLLLLGWCSLAVGAGLYWLAPDLRQYVGLSGVLHGLLVVAPFWSQFYSRRFAWLFAAAISLKVLWEQSPWYDDMAMFGLIGGRVETRAHLFGLLAGGAAVLLVAGWRRYFQPSGQAQ
ncbi:rhombosortase [Oceanobacter mangrovi]|uniref:rhombosortase n=1 Tax=Oceanobacter mangrovi TaxID=2862510 RepID=UPI001C8D8182|nr:rhombosortase [Oceanobacter mangrovi]